MLVSRKRASLAQRCPVVVDCNTSILSAFGIEADLFQTLCCVPFAALLTDCFGGSMPWLGYPQSSMDRVGVQKTYFFSATKNSAALRPSRGLGGLRDLNGLYGAQGLQESPRP